MEHNAIAKSKQTFFYKLGINGPGLIEVYLLEIFESILLYVKHSFDTLIIRISEYYWFKSNQIDEQFVILFTFQY